MTSSLEDAPANHFTVGIVDDVSHSSLQVDPTFDTEGDDTMRAVFFGLGSDGTVSANKNTVKIIGERTDLHAQGYFVLRLQEGGRGDDLPSALRPASRSRSTYLIRQADFVACHQFELLERTDVLAVAGPARRSSSTARTGPRRSGTHLPREVQAAIVDKGLRFYVVDGYAVAREAGLGTRINTVLQTCFFALADILPIDEAIGAIKEAVATELRQARRDGRRAQRRRRSTPRSRRCTRSWSRPRRPASDQRPPAVPPEAPPTSCSASPPR